MSVQTDISMWMTNLGAAIAIAISWSLYKSIWWAILHGILGWFYVIHYACTRQKTQQEGGTI